MGLESKHPQYSEFFEDWMLLRDCFSGERRVKLKSFQYLPPTSGMVDDGVKSTSDRGFKNYDSYRRRARFPDLVKEAVKALLGVMHNKPATIELPSVMEGMLERATLRNESLQMLLRRINEEQLITGRTGLLGDFISTETDPERGGQPYLVLYEAERLINWDDGNRDEIDVESLNLVVIDETEDERQTDFEWESVEKYRVLALGDIMDNEAAGAGTYQVGVFRETQQFDPSAMITPMFGGTPATEIPFVFINPVDIVAEPDFPPLLGLANMSMGIYMGEADYRQSLFMQGQDTLVLIGKGDGKETRVGAGATIEIPIGGDAKYIGVDSTGLVEQRAALENDYSRGQQMAGQLLDSVSRERESGEALQVRVAARTATLNQIALSGAFGLQSILRKMATWMGANPDEVVVTPNLDFVDDRMTGQDLSQIMGGKMLGGPISLETIHLLMQQRGMTEKTFAEELEAIENESDLEISRRNMAAGSRGFDDEDDDDDEGPEDEDDEAADEETGGEVDDDDES